MSDVREELKKEIRSIEDAATLGKVESFVQGMKARKDIDRTQRAVALPDAAKERAEGMSDGACEKKPKWRKAYGIALGALVAVLVAGAFGWAWLSGPLQQIEPREEGEAPNLAKALTMWQDPDKVVRLLGIGESQTSLNAMPGDLQKYGTKLGVWGQVYVAATNKTGATTCWGQRREQPGRSSRQISQCGILRDSAIPRRDG